MKRRHLGGVLLLIVACSRRSEPASPPPAASTPQAPIKVMVMPPKSGALTYQTQLSGDLLAAENVAVGTQVMGVVSALYFDEGTHVRRGQILLRLDARLARLAVHEAQAAVAAQRATTQSCEQQQRRLQALQAQSPSFFRGQELADVGAALRAQQAKLQQSAVSLQMARLALSQHVLVSPVDGVVHSRSVLLGKPVASHSVVAQIVRSGPALLRFAVPGSLAVHLTPGLRLGFGPPYDPAAFQAEVLSVGPVADSSSRQFTVRARSHNQVPLLLGTAVTVNICIRSDAAARSIAPAGIVHDEQGTWAYVVQDGRAHRQSIQTGLFGGAGAQQVVGGLGNNQQVIVGSESPLYEGARVQPVSGLLAADAR